MICPSCGAEVAAMKFCENCGSPLSAAQEQTVPLTQSDDLAAGLATAPAIPVAGATGSAPSPEPLSAQSTAPAESVYSPEVPGDSAWVAKSQQAYQDNQAMQMPPQSSQVGSGYTPPMGAGQPPYPPSTSYQMPPSGNRAPNTAFVLVIVGLVLSILFVTFLPGLVCSIIGLVLNAGYNKKGMDNPHKTSTMVVGVIGIVIGVLCIVFSIIVGVMTAQVVDELDKRGVDIATDSVQISTDSSGNINITVDGSSSSAAAGGSIAVSSSASSETASSTAPSPMTLPTDYDDARFHDSGYNPTLYSLVELTGAEMQELLDYYNFYWNNDAKSWLASDGSLFDVAGKTGSLTKEEIDALPKGAAGQPVVMYLTVEGYDSPSAALSAASENVVVHDSHDTGGVLFAVVYGSPLVEYLVAVSETGTNEQTFLLFTNEAISSGLFEDLVGVNAGSSIDEVWKTIKSI